jgi:hypothetical protein
MNSLRASLDNLRRSQAANEPQLGEEPKLWLIIKERGAFHPWQITYVHMRHRVCDEDDVDDPIFGRERGLAEIIRGSRLDSYEDLTDEGPALAKKYGRKARPKRLAPALEVITSSKNSSDHDANDNDGDGHAASGGHPPRKRPKHDRAVHVLEESGKRHDVSHQEHVFGSDDAVVLGRQMGSPIDLSEAEGSLRAGRTQKAASEESVPPMEEIIERMRRQHQKDLQEAYEEGLLDAKQHELDALESREQGIQAKISKYIRKLVTLEAQEALIIDQKKKKVQTMMRR